MRFWPFLESIAQDTRVGARSLRRHPAVFLTAVLTLGFAIGINSSVFTVFNAVALRPWPVPDANRVVCLLSAPKGESPAPKFSLAAYQYFSERTSSFSGLIATRHVELRVGQDENARRAYGLLVTPNYFQVLQVGFRLGRPFSQEEGRQAVAVLSHSFWQTRFAENPGIVGRQIRFDGVPFTIVGVTPPEFSGTSGDGQDFWIPEGAESFLLPHGSPALELTRSVNFESWAMAGRLAEGADLRRAQSEIDVLNRQFRADQRLQPTDVLAAGTSLISNPSARSEMLPVFALIFAGVILILLLASANVGNLILARAASRQKEIAARLALGAGRMRLVRQLVTESALLALVAGGLGVFLASWLPRVLLLAYTGERLDWLRPDFLVLVYTLLASLGACLVFGLAPALHATRLSLADAVKSQYSRLGRYSLRSFLLAAQVAISVVLLICAGLMVRGVHAVSSQDPGFSMTGVSWAQVRLPANVYNAERSQALMEELRAEAASSGLWNDVALTTHVPLGPGRSGLGISYPGTERVKMVASEEVCPEYFQLLKIPVLYGRGFGPGDRGRNVVVINETLAKLLAPGRPAVGAIARSGRKSRDSYEVIGVVKDVHTADLYSVDPTLYRLVSNGAAQASPFRPIPSLLLKSNGGPPGDKALQAMVMRLEPTATVQVRPLSANIDGELKPARVAAGLAGALGLVALGLAAVGLLGVFAYSVRRQSREIATRLALGARPGQVVGQVLRSSSRPAGLGLIVGLVASLAASRLLEVHLYGVSTVEPVTYLCVGLLVAVSALGASIWPAWMITRIQPAGALRAD